MGYVFRGLPGADGYRSLELKEVYIIRGKAYYVYNSRIIPEN